MNVFRTIDEDGRRPIVHVAGKHPVALCPSCSVPSVTTNGTGWRDVIDVVGTVVVTLSICVRRFVCEFDDCAQHTFDERFEGIGCGGATERALAFFADLQRGRATRRVAIDLKVPQHYLRVAVGRRRLAAHERTRGRLGRHLGIDECSVRKNVSNTSETPMLIDARNGYSYRGNELTPTRDVYVLDGNNMLVSRHLVEVLGGFDDDCFMYYEDADLCARALALGYRIRFCAEMQVWHRRNLSSDCIPYRQQYLAQRNHLVFVARHFPAASGPTATSLVCSPAEARSSRTFERGGPLAG
jgi:hypothetical protein